MKRIALIIAVIFLACLKVLPCHAAREFYASDDLSTERSIDTEQIQSINSINASNHGPAPYNAALMLHGPHRMSITVLDDKTLHPVKEYVIHAVIQAIRKKNHAIYPPGYEPSDGEPDTVKPIRIEYFDVEESVGRLESKKVSDPVGACRYDDLGALTVEFQVLAKGYLPKSEVVQIPHTPSSLFIRLSPAGVVTGRIIDYDGEPAEGIEVGLEYSDEHEDRHYSFWNDQPRSEKPYSAKSDTEGRFRIEGLPADCYEVTFPNLFSSIGQLSDQVSNEIHEATSRSNAEEKIDHARYERLRSEKLNEPFVITPKLPPLDLKEDNTVELGTIRLERAPMIQLEILYEGQIPLDNFPFELATIKGHELVSPYHGTTGDDGCTSLPLVGWQPGFDMIVLAPAEKEGVFQIPQLTAHRPDPVAGFDLKRYYGDSFCDPVKLRHGWPEEYEKLTPQQMTELHQNAEDEKQSLRQQEARIAALPEHPNYVIFTPKRGQVNKIKLNYKSVAGDLDLLLAFRDKATQAPIRHLVGFVREGTPSMDWFSYRGGVEQYVSIHSESTRVFRSADNTGRVAIPALSLTPPLSVAVEADGYVRQMFEVPLELARAGKELVFELEPAAQVRGRVVLATSGEPLTTATLTRLIPILPKRPYPDSPILPPRILLRNDLAETGRRDPTLSAIHYQLYAGATPASDGRFELTGLRPHDSWMLSVETAGLLPKTVLSPLVLHPGMNDLGDIKVGLAGIIQGRITDERGNGLGGVHLEILQSEVGSPSHDVQTTTSGIYRAELKTLETDKTVVRFTPPWGKISEHSTTRSLETIIAYDTAVTLDRCAVTTLSTRLDYGNTLRVEIPPSPLRNDLISSYSNPAIWSWVTGFRKGDGVVFSIARVALQSLQPNPEGFVYHQLYCLRDQTATLPTTGPLVLQLDHVPAGRLAVRVDGVFFGPHPVMGMRQTMTNMEIVPVATIPLAYTEIDMPTTTTTCRVKLNPVDIEVELTDRPPQWNFDPFMLLDRTEPISTFHGGDFRRTLVLVNRGVPQEPEVFQTSMVGCASEFTRLDETTRQFCYRPALLRAVPPGTYHLQLFADMVDAMSNPPNPYYETEIKVPQGGGMIRISAPWQARKKATPPMPVTQ